MFEGIRDKFNSWAKTLPTTPSASVTTKTEEGMILDRIRKTFETGVVNAEIGMFRWTGKGPEDIKTETVPIWQRQQIKEIVAEMGGEATVHAGLSVDLTWPTPNKRMQSIRELKHTLLYARDVGAKIVTVHPTSMQGGNAFFDTVLFSPETKGPWYGGGEAEKEMREKVAKEVGYYTDEYFKRMEAWRKGHMRRTLETAFGKGSAEVDGAIYSTGIELYMKFLQGMTQLFGFYKEAKEVYEPQSIVMGMHAEFLEKASKIIDNPHLANDEKNAEVAALAKYYMSSKVMGTAQRSKIPLDRIQPIANQLFGQYMAKSGPGPGGRVPTQGADVVEKVVDQLSSFRKQYAENKGLNPEEMEFNPQTVSEMFKEGDIQGLKGLRREAAKWDPGLKGFDARYVPITGAEFIDTLVKSFETLLEDKEVQHTLNKGEVKMTIENMQMTNLSTGELGAPYFTKPEHFKKALREVWKIAKRKGVKNPEKVIGMTYDILHSAIGANPVEFMKELQTETVDENGEKLPAVPIFNVHVAGGPINAYGGISHQHAALGDRGDQITMKNPKLLENISQQLEEMRAKGIIDETPPITIEPGEGGTEDTEKALTSMWTAGGEAPWAFYANQMNAGKEWGYDQADEQYYKDIREQQSVSMYPEEQMDSAMDRNALFSQARSTFMESLYSTAGAQKDVAPAMWAGGMSHRDVGSLPKPWVERFYFTGDGR